MQNWRVDSDTANAWRVPFGQQPLHRTLAQRHGLVVAALVHNHGEAQQEPRDAAPGAGPVAVRVDDVHPLAPHQANELEEIARIGLAVAEGQGRAAGRLHLLRRLVPALAAAQQHAETLRVEVGQPPLEGARHAVQRGFPSSEMLAQVEDRDPAIRRHFRLRITCAGMPAAML
jgi:hypothetical protein